MTPTVVSLFSGCGGSSPGYKMAGYDVKLAVEWDDNAVDTYRKNFPNTKVYHGDVAKLSYLEALEMSGLEPGQLDVLDGSPPCQGFSTAGKRKLTDKRNRLFEEYVRLLRAFQPKAFVMENVSGMVKGKMRLVFVECLRALKGAGYDVAVRVLNAKWYGVPQSRQRTIFIGIRLDLGIKPSHPAPISAPKNSGDAISGILEKGPEITNEKGKKLWAMTLPGKSFSSVHPKGHWFNAVKLHPKKPCPTITKLAMKSGCAGVFHWDEPRLLGTQELKRLASFPDDFNFVGKWEQTVARIGNSVPPLFMKAVAAHVRTLLNGKE